MLNDIVRQCALDSVLCWLATADEHGQPNVSPKEIFAVFDPATFVIAEIASPISARNLAQNAQVCVSFVDVFRQKGFKLIGTATLLLPDHPDFAVKAAELIKMAGSHFKVRGVFEISVTKVHRIMAPSYVLFPDQTEAQAIAAAYRRYGVQARG